MRTVKASEFKAKCLKLMDDVQQSGEGIIITKNGKPVSKLVPYRVTVPTLLGLHRGKVISGENDIFSTGENWDSSG